MQINFSRWILIFLIAALILCVLMGEASAAFGWQLLDDPYPSLQTDTEIETHSNSTLSLIMGAFVIVLVILGAVLLRRPKS